MTSRRIVSMLGAIVLVTLVFPFAGNSSQRRDHLTEQEVEQIKDTQILDKRIDVFVKAVERRLRVLTGTTTDNAKQQKKDAELYGALPTGSRAELVGDIAKILDEAITNIDDVSSRDEKNPLIAKSLRTLAAEATRIVGQLRPLEAQAKDDAEIASFGQLSENAESILGAANRLPPPTEKEKKDKSKADKSKAKT
ncbi:MAG: hypothetical protein ACR2LM_06265 [Pyrinomonadaceae bacterium]